MDWKNFDLEIKSLFKKIGYKPNVVVAITRGGLIPGRILSSHLQVREMYCLTVQKDCEERKVVTEILSSLQGKQVLLVEDMLETGKSLIVAKQYLESKGATVKTVCLYVMPFSEIVPDFFLKKVNEIEIFPWEQK